METVKRPPIEIPARDHIVMFTVSPIGLLVTATTADVYRAKMQKGSSRIRSVERIY